MKAKNLNSRRYWQRRGTKEYESRPKYQRDDLDEQVVRRVQQDGHKMEEIINEYPYKEVFGFGDDSYHSDEHAE